MHADISVNDDALCLKAGRDSDGLRVNRPTHRASSLIHDNIVRDGAAGITFGFGPPAASVTLKSMEGMDTTLEHVPVGILFKSAHTRGGFAGEDVRIHDIKHGPAPPVVPAASP